MQKFILVLLVSGYLTSEAQTVSYQSLSSGGGFYKNLNHSNSWTVGQLFSTTLASTNHKLTQGFQQAAERDIRISGFIRTEIDTPISGVTVSLSGSASKTLITGADGAYKFNVLKGSNYSITPSKSNDINTANGISTFDIILLQRHVLAMETLNSPYKILAAALCSSTADTTVTTIDIVRIRQMILINVSAFPSGRLWEFVSGFASSSPFSFIRTRTYSNLPQSYSNQNFTGVKLGDVNNSWNKSIP